MDLKKVYTRAYWQLSGKYTGQVFTLQEYGELLPAETGIYIRNRAQMRQNDLIGLPSRERMLLTAGTIGQALGMHAFLGESGILTGVQLTARTHILGTVLLAAEKYTWTEGLESLNLLTESIQKWVSQYGSIPVVDPLPFVDILISNQEIIPTSPWDLLSAFEFFFGWVKRHVD